MTLEPCSKVSYRCLVWTKVHRLGRFQMLGYVITEADIQRGLRLPCLSSDLELKLASRLESLPIVI